MKHVAAVTTGGVLVLVELTGKYGVRSAAYYGGDSRFRGDGIAMLTGPPDYNGFTLAAVTTTGRLVCFDAAGHTGEPATLAEHPESIFSRVIGGTVADGWIYVHAITGSGTIVELRSGKIDDPPVLSLPWLGWTYMRLASFDELEKEAERGAPGGKGRPVIGGPPGARPPGPRVVPPRGRPRHSVGGPAAPRE